MAVPDVLGRCPFCGEELVVRRLDCPGCHTSFEGTFSLGRFQRLSPEQLAFLEVFVKNRGVIRDVERELGVSYPTVRNRLDDLIRALGYEVGEESTGPEMADDAARRRQVLERLSAGEITADEALQLLKR
ncbi:MAG TPA: DUF2089 domain-containing protein [Chloroflexota bacterium]|jgi:hypothetical protein|nr:DUF2089 domain-containing protein [Chloroflexota bacterium]